MPTDCPPSHQTTIPEEHLEFIERLLFYELDEAISKHRDGYPNYDEVLAYENALETMTSVRELLSDRQDAEVIKENADIVFEALDIDDHDGLDHTNQ